MNYIPGLRNVSLTTGTADPVENWTSFRLFHSRRISKLSKQCQSLCLSVETLKRKLLHRYRPGNNTGGAYNIFGLLNPKGRSCFFYQLILAIVSDFLWSRLLRDVFGPALNLLSDKLNQFFDPERAKIGKFDLKVYSSLLMCVTANINDNFAAQFPGIALGNQ